MAPKNEPIIRPLPTVEGFIRNVDLVLGSDADDAQIRGMVDLIMTPANPEDDHSWSLANAAARHAFAKSGAFEEAFREFTNGSSEFTKSADRFEVLSERSM